MVITQTVEIRNTISAKNINKNLKYNEIEILIHNQWRHYYDLGVKYGELSGNVESDLAISLFRSLYYGDSFLLAITGDGLSIQELRRKYMLIYNAVK